MKENKLISMVEFVLKSELDYTSQTTGFDKIKQYAKFLNQPLNLGMFVPAIEVGGRWEVISELQVSMHQQAKNKVIFEGFKSYNPERNSHGFSVISDTNGLPINFSLSGVAKYPFKTIQDLTKYKPLLTNHGMQISGLK